jgi:hypothetical protein
MTSVEGTLEDFAFGALGAGLRAEVESSSGEATAIKSFFDGISNREH